MTPSRRVPPALLPLLLLATAFSPAPSRAASNVVISQVYGGGGNSGSTYRNDFIELFNRSGSPVSLAGMSVQYASAAGSTWQSTALSGTIAAGQYYLVQEAQGAGGSVNLPTPDATGTIAMGATTGKVALVNTTALLSGDCFAIPIDLATVLDRVGFGATASCFEGSGRAPAPSNTNATLRASGGCTDTDNNNADFAAGAPTPRNTASPFNSCGSTSTNPTGVGAANPGSVPAGSPSLLTVTVTPGTGPPSTGLAVVADLSSIGGSSNQPLVESG